MTVLATETLGWSAGGFAALGVSSLRELYLSTAVFEAERRSLFRSAWHVVAAAEDLDGGRFVATSVAGVPVGVWRDADGGLRAFHNICRHRGLPLVSGTGQTGRYLTCPYHQWSFALDGSLVRVPQPEQFPGLDAAGLGLHPVAVGEWQGLVFVCPGQPVAPLATALAPLDRLTVPAGYVEVGRAEYVVACNWKFLVENHVDVYHLWYLHQRSLAPYEHRAFRWEWVGDTWWSWEPHRDRAGSDAVARGGIGAHLLFPNVMLVTTDDYFATYDAVPVGSDRTHLTLRIRSAPGADGAALVDSVRSFLAEDVVACEALQAGAASPMFGLGPLAASHEEPIRRFHAGLRRRLGVDGHE